PVGTRLRLAGHVPGGGGTTERAPPPRGPLRRGGEGVRGWGRRVAGGGARHPAHVPPRGERGRGRGHCLRVLVTGSCGTWQAPRSDDEAALRVAPMRRRHSWPCRIR